jgi:hypothetical protein
MSTQLGVNYDFYKTGQQSLGPLQILARVDRVILGPTQADGKPDEDFKRNGLWASIGAIRYTIMYTTEVVPNQNSTIAKPYSPNNTHYPAEGEIVELVYGPSSKLNDNGLEKELYYKNPINLWNSVHHNAFPNFLNLATRNDNLNVTYEDTTNGIAPAPTTSSQTPSLGIPEKPNIKNLQPIPGDITMQGRWGQSIRFGSTSRNNAIKTPWSSAGNNGDPIMIIRNGQTDAKGSDPWTTLVEDINSDPASIYLCSGQAILIQDLNNFKLDSFTVNSKVPETNIQPLKRPPTSTDAVSPVSQSQQQLKYAQASAQINIPSTVPQTTVTITPPYDPLGIRNLGSTPITNTSSFSPIPTVPTPNTSRQITTAQGFVGPLPDTGSNPIISITTTTVLPTGQVSSSTVNVPYDPFGIGKLGNAAATALTQLPTAPSIATPPTGSKPIAAGGAQVETGAELEVIVAEESEFKFTFDLDLTETVEYGDGSEENVSPPNQGLIPDDNAGSPPPTQKVPANKGGTGTGPRAIVPNTSNISDSRVEVIPGSWQTNDGTTLKNLSHVNGKPVCVPMIKAVLAMKDACLAETKQQLIITSGFRPPFNSIRFTTKSGALIEATGQLQLCGPKGKKGCARPGSSRHGNGIAIDTNTGTSYPLPSYTSPWNPVIGKWMFMNSWKFGFIRGVIIEEWHFEYRPGSTVFSIVPRGHVTWHGIDKLIPDS